MACVRPTKVKTCLIKSGFYSSGPPHLCGRNEKLRDGGTLLLLSKQIRRIRTLLDHFRRRGSVGVWRVIPHVDRQLTWKQPGTTHGSSHGP